MVGKVLLKLKGKEFMVLRGLLRAEIAFAAMKEDGGAIASYARRGVSSPGSFA